MKPSLRNLLLSSLAVSALLPVAAGAQNSPVPTTVILRNGVITTQDGQDRTVAAVAILGDRIIAAGADNDVMPLRAAKTCVVDLKGKAVIPGLSDSHIHTGYEDADDLANLVPARDMNEVLLAISMRAMTASPGEVIETTGDWHEGQLKERRLPTVAELDKAAPNHPVVVTRGGHSYILNTLALRKYGITRDTVAPAGGSIPKDTRGELTGELVDRAKNLVKLDPPPAKNLEDRLAALRREQAHYTSLGLTSYRVPGVGVEEMKDYVEMYRRGMMTARASVLLRWDRVMPAAQYRKELEAWPINSTFGDEWLRFDGIKLGVDGGYEGGWLSKPYLEPYGRGGTYYGLNTVKADLYLEMVRLMNELDLRPSTHVVGDQGLDMILDTFEKINAEKSIIGKRWAIEHAFITRPEQIERMKKLGLVISAQSHLYLAGSSLVTFWGKDRAEQVAPVNAWLKAGIPVAGGTDNKLPYVPEAPLTTFYHWVTRDTQSAGVLGPEEKISRKQALAIATKGGAYLTFEEKLKGTLEPGMLADMVVLSQDIMTVPDNRLMDTKVLATLVGGKFVYSADDGPKGCGD